MQLMLPVAEVRPTPEQERWLALFEPLVADALQAIYVLQEGAPVVDYAIFRETAQQLLSGLDIGIGEATLGYTADERLLVEALRNNVFKFSAAKSYQEMKLFTSLLKNTEGGVRSFTEFRDEALKAGKRFNVDWLEAEYRTAINSGQAAVNWAGYERQKDVLPLLRYSAVMDGRTRPPHAALNGLTMPVGDPRWNSIAPPNGWNCRCRLIQKRKGETEPDEAKKQYETGLKDVPIEFRNNPGTSGMVYGPMHPYFMIPVKDKALIKQRLNVDV